MIRFDVVPYIYIYKYPYLCFYLVHLSPFRDRVKKSKMHFFYCGERLSRGGLAPTVYTSLNKVLRKNVIVRPSVWSKSRGVGNTVRGVRGRRAV